MKKYPDHGGNASAVDDDDPLDYMRFYFEWWRRNLGPLNPIETRIFMFLALHLAEYGYLPSKRSKLYEIARCTTSTHREKLAEIVSLFDAKSAAGNDIRKMSKTARERRAENRVNAGIGGEKSALNRFMAASNRLPLRSSERLPKNQANAQAKLIRSKKELSSLTPRAPAREDEPSGATETPNGNGSAPAAATASAPPTGAPPPLPPERPRQKRITSGSSTWGTDALRNSRLVQTELAAQDVTGRSS
jgi:hypothetical protein